MPLTVTELVTYLREPVPDADMVALMQLVEIANGLVEEVTGPLAVEPPRVAAIRLEAAARAYRNPRGYDSETKSIDDFTHTWRAGSGGRGGVYLTEAERQDLVSLTAAVAATTPWSGSLPYRSSW